MIVVWVQTLLAFVNFKLYHSINVKYPPILDPQLEASAAGMLLLLLLLLLLLSFSSRVGEGGYLHLYRTFKWFMQFVCLFFPQSLCSTFFAFL